MKRANDRPGPRLNPPRWLRFAAAAPALPGEAVQGFGWIDSAVIVGVLVGITIFGRLVAGRQETDQDFFAGGRRLPWYAIGASIVATELSAVTYVSLPSIVFRPGGDLRFLQIALFGYVLSRLLVARYFVPAYFRRDLLSPYDLITEKLGTSAGQTATGLFMFGGILAQASRVYLTAVVLQVLLGAQLAGVSAATGASTLVLSVALVGVVSILWTWIGGIAAVVWTDALLFVLLGVGAVVASWFALAQADLSVAGLISQAAAEGKLRFIDFDFAWTRPYTFWAAILGASWGGLCAFGADQLIAQRLFCARSERDARWAMLFSNFSVVITAGVMFMGLALWGFFQAQPPTGEAAAQIAAQPDRVLPWFILESMPVGLRGLVIAGALAAAISSLDSILAALAQTTSSLRPGPPGREVARARWLVVGWGFVLCSVAVALQPVAQRYGALLDLALAMAGYTGGALLAGVLLALWTGRWRFGRGYVVAAPLSVLCVLGAVWHQTWAFWTLVGLCVALAAAVAATHPHRRALPLLVIALGSSLSLGLSRFAVTDGGAFLSWPWYIPLGCTVSLLGAWVLRDPGPLHEDA